MEPTTKEKQSAPITDGERWTTQFYFGIVVLSSIAIFESISLIHFSHRTTLRCIIFYSMSVVKMCLHGYDIATVYRQCKMLFIYPLINLSSKKTMQNRYSTNVTFLDYEYNWIKGLINRYKEVFLVGWWWNRINWNVIRHLKSDRKIFVVKLL